MHGTKVTAVAWPGTVRVKANCRERKEIWKKRRFDAQRIVVKESEWSSFGGDKKHNRGQNKFSHWINTQGYFRNYHYVTTY